ncbi:hypothetical protein GCM10010176_082380 [Nonomuraea spiralis]|nr:hypothetical protein GCM10010176_082380 [Nonomuraea spiralis]
MLRERIGMHRLRDRLLDPQPSYTLCAGSPRIVGSVRISAFALA